MADPLKTIEDLARFYNDEKQKWLLEWIPKIVPSVVCKWATEKRHLEFVAGYFERNKINLVEHPDGTTELHKNGKMVSQFHYQLAWLKDGKCVKTGPILPNCYQSYPIQNLMCRLGK